MGRHTLTGEPVTTALFKQLVDAEGEQALAELCETRLDAIAGIWALTDWERFVHQACRARFGSYEPTIAKQAVFIGELNRQRRRRHEPIAA